MEAGEVRRGGRIISAGTPARSKGAELPGPNARAGRADRVALSAQALRFLEEQNRQVQEEARRRQESGEGGGLVKSLERDLKKLDKCQKIYARIASGDKVPPEDRLYLERHDPEGFKLALAMRRPKKNPREWKSLLDDEDRAALASGEEGGPPARPGSAPSAD